MQQYSSWLTYRGVSVLPLVMALPLFILACSEHWSYDEAMTYMNILDATPMEVIRYEKYRFANNHVLNSLYFLVLNKAGVTSLLAYRLPNFLAFFIYFWLISKLLKEQPGYQLRHIDQLMLYLWPYAVYFAQGRGYAMALVCMLGALVVLKRYLDEGKPQQLLGIVLLGGLSSLSIFSFIFPFASMLIVAGLSRFRQVIKSPLQWLILVLALPVAWYIFDKGRVVSEYDYSIIGGQSLFRGGTLSSLVSFLALTDLVPNNVFLALKVLILLTLAPALYLLIRRGTMYLELTIALVTMLLLVVAHYAFGAMYPLYRSAAYLVILLLLAFTYSNFRKNVLYTLHFSAITISGLIFMGYLFYFMSQKSMDDVLNEIAADPGPVLIQDVHPAPMAVNHMRRQDSLDLNVCITYDTPCFDRQLDTAKYVI
ncbi:MAG: hypothetical protein K8F30_12780, partial [Taibaiella sp.]|nr:hypothetical protein [Taibaiella sp.]